MIWSMFHMITRTIKLTSYNRTLLLVAGLILLSIILFIYFLHTTYNYLYNKPGIQINCVRFAPMNTEHNYLQELLKFGNNV